MAAKITNKLLKEAIADAEAVRETAIANAKLVLEESITPQIKGMIARRLRVEAEGAEDEEDKEEAPAPAAEPKGGEGGEAAVETPELAGDEDPSLEQEATELPHEEGEADGGEGPEDTSAIGTGDNKEPSADSFDTSDVGNGPENAGDSPADWYDDWDEADFDLGEIIKELEGDIAALAGKDSEEGEEEAPAPAPEPAPETEDDDKPVTESKDEDADDKKEDKKELKESEDADADDVGGDSDAEEVDLDEILAELDAETTPEPEGDEKKMMMAKLAGLKNELSQYREAVNVLRSRLQEVNLLNAKLLFTNKMFRKEGLNNDQKVRIVESFDRATTVREVKLVYTALVENLSLQAKTFNASRKRVVTEGLASKATPSTAPKSKEVIVENTVARRLQELAGII